MCVKGTAMKRTFTVIVVGEVVNCLATWFKKKLQKLYPAVGYKVTMKRSRFIVVHSPSFTILLTTF